MRLLEKILSAIGIFAGTVASLLVVGLLVVLCIAISSEGSKPLTDATVSPRPTVMWTEMPRPTIVPSAIPSPRFTPKPTPKPTPTPTEEPYCGIWIEVSDYCGNYNHVGNEWTTRHYVSWDGYNYTELTYDALWLNLSSPATLYIKTYISEYDEGSSDSYTSKYSFYLDFDKRNDSPGAYYTITQTTDIVEDGGSYAGNSCTWDTEWKITFLYNY